MVVFFENMDNEYDYAAICNTSLHENTNDISNTSKSKDSRRMYLYMIDTFVEACFQEVKPSLLQSN
jgi:hypothetical protein